VSGKESKMSFSRDNSIHSAKLNHKGTKDTKKNQNLLRKQLVANELDSQLLDFMAFSVFFVPLWLINIAVVPKNLVFCSIDWGQHERSSPAGIYAG
jgi:hypothetical protein